MTVHHPPELCFPARVVIPGYSAPSTKPPVQPCAIPTLPGTYLRGGGRTRPKIGPFPPHVLVGGGGCGPSPRFSMGVARKPRLAHLLRGLREVDSKDPELLSALKARAGQLSHAFFGPGPNSETETETEGWGWEPWEVKRGGKPPCPADATFLGEGFPFKPN